MLSDSQPVSRVAIAVAIMKLVSTQLMVSLEAPSAAFMKGSATLAMVASRNWQSETSTTPNQQPPAMLRLQQRPVLNRHRGEWITCWRR